MRMRIIGAWIGASVMTFGFIVIGHFRGEPLTYGETAILAGVTFLVFNEVLK